MKSGANFIDYGIYIDRKHAYIISLNHVALEKFMAEEVVFNDDDTRTTKVDDQVHTQNYRNDELIKMCKNIMTKIVYASNILIFGPSKSKFELQNEIQNNRRLKHVAEDLKTTDVMNKDEAIRFASDHYTVAQVGQQVFTGEKND